MKDYSPTSTGRNNAAGDNNPWNPGNHLSVRWVMQFTMFLAVFAVVCMFFFISSTPIQTPTFSRYLTVDSKEVTFSLFLYFFLRCYAIFIVLQTIKTDIYVFGIYGKLFKNEHAGKQQLVVPEPSHKT